MLDIEKYKKELEGILPKDEYVPLTRTDKTIPAQLLKTFSNIPRDASGNMLGKIVTTQHINHSNKITKQIQAIFLQIQASLPESRSFPVCDK